jgi:hypothetical protein
MSKEKCSIVFTGDIGFDRYMANRWTDSNLLSQSVLDFFIPQIMLLQMLKVL